MNNNGKGGLIMTRLVTGFIRRKGVVAEMYKTRYKKYILASLLINVALFYAPLSNAAPVYKVVDKQTGRVTFTDNPQKYEQQSDKKISQMNIIAPTPATNNSASSASTSVNSAGSLSTPQIPAQPMTANPKANYQLTILEPSSERAYRRPAQNVDVKVQIKPTLQVGDIATIYLDGNQVTQGLSASIATVDMLPGAHTIKVTVSNEKGQSLAQVSRTIYVIQNTPTLQNNKKIAQQLLAYEQLPWHQKILLKLRQDNIQLNNPPNKPKADTPMTLEQPIIK